jgi:hypothetical protein
MVLYNKYPNRLGKLERPIFKIIRWLMVCDFGHWNLEFICYLGFGRHATFSFARRAGAGSLFVILNLVLGAYLIFGACYL